MKTNLPTVSVVITTKNEERHIANCLKSIKKQTYPSGKIEIIIVDNHSTDKTKAIAKKFTDKIYDCGPERSAQRNFGAKKAKGIYYLYLDADMVLSPEAISECVSRCQKDYKIVGLYVPEIIVGDSYWSKVRRFERSFYGGTVIDAVRFIRLKDFISVGGFDETMSGPEDWDLDKKIRSQGKVDIIKSVIYHNESEFNLSNYLKKKSYYTKSFENYINKWGRKDPDIVKQFGVKYRYAEVFIENKKWGKIITSPHLVLGMFFLRFLVGITYLLNR